MKPRAVPARLHVLLAPRARKAVVIRRGPSKHTAIVGWDLANDTFRLGQWLYGRVYERRCDLSPDGRHLVYFAMNGRWDSRVRGAWSAVSRAPWLKALSLFAKGDCWHGGGLFLSAKEYWLNDGYGHEVLEDGAPVRRVRAYPGHVAYGGECPGVYYLRLQRDGWTLAGRGPEDARGRVVTFEKRVNDQWTLRKLAHETIDHPVGRGCYFDTHALVHRDGDVVGQPDWEWVDVDGARLVWAAGGRLYAGRVAARGLGGAEELHDFRAMTFEKIAAPY